MNELGDAGGPTHAFARDDIVVLPAAASRTGGPGLWLALAAELALVILCLSCGSALGSWLVLRQLPAGTAIPQPWRLALGPIAGMALWGLLRIPVRRALLARRTRALQRELAGDPRVAADARVRAYLHFAMRFSTMGAWLARFSSEFVRALRAEGPCVACVDERFAAQLAAIPVLPGAVEPDGLPRNATSTRRWRAVAALLLVISIAPQVYFFGPGGLLVLLPGIAAGLLFTVPFLLWNKRSPGWVPIMMGQGWVEHGKLRWSSLDSIMVVRPSPIPGTIDVRVVGRHGSIALFATRVTDPAFQEIWQRWTHPHPNVVQGTFDA